MKFFRRMTWVAGAIALFALGGCGTLSECQKSTAIGAGVGGVAGSVLSGGSTAGTVGGAVAGGVIGNKTNHRC